MDDKINVCLKQRNDKFKMSQFTILDDIFIGGEKHNRKQSTREVLGSTIISHSGHQRYHSKQFVPFSFQRDIKNQLISSSSDLFYNKSQSFCKLGSGNLEQSDSQFKSKKKSRLLIDDRFKLNAVNHFKEHEIRSQIRTLSKFKQEVEKLENKDYLTKYPKAKAQEQIFNRLFSQTMSRQNQHNHQHDDTHRTNLFRSTSVQFLSQPQLQVAKKSLQKKSEISSSYSNLPSSKSLLKQKHRHNPELQEIQRHVKVHFNHPELDRLKQSRRLTFKPLQKLEQGDKKFKAKTEYYRMMKEKIKKQMTKF